MLCRYPLVLGHTLPVPCGQCMSCRINKRREWASRILLESFGHKENAFVTLTYDDDHLPPDLSLNPKHLQDWLKRLRKQVLPHRLRFFGVGEYGDKTFRPHYHLILFGFPSCTYGRPRISSNSSCPCMPCRLISRTWRFGFSYLGSVTSESANYTASYTLKKMTQKDDSRLNGRHPEFARMSNRPGIGTSFVDQIASGLDKIDLDIHFNGDLPPALKMANKSLPLGKYLKRKIRESLGRDARTPQHIIDDYVNDAVEWLNDYLSNNEVTRKDKHSIAYRERFKFQVDRKENLHKIYQSRKGGSL